MTPMMRMRTVAKTGRLTLIFASHCMVRFSLGKDLGSLDARAVFDFAGGGLDDLLARLHAREHGDGVAHLLASFDDALFDLLVLHDEHAVERPFFVHDAQRNGGRPERAELDPRRG